MRKTGMPVVAWVLVGLLAIAADFVRASGFGSFAGSELIQSERDFGFRGTAKKERVEGRRAFGI